jgi:hypothetical protein
MAESHYRTFFSDLNASFGANLRVNSREISISGADTTAFLKTLNRHLPEEPTSQKRILVIELLDIDADVDLYDYLCNDVLQELRHKPTSRPWCIVFMVANPEQFLESVILQRLLAICRDREICLILLSTVDRPDFEPKVLSEGHLRLDSLPQSGSQHEDRLQRVEAENRLTPAQVRKGCDLLFGHFSIRHNENLFHTPVVASVRRLASDPNFVRQLNGDIADHLEDTNFAVLPLGIDSGGIDELAIALVDNAFERRLSFPVAFDGTTSSVVVLCDIISRTHPLSEIVQDLRQRGFSRILITGITRFMNTPEIQSVDQYSYYELPLQAISTKDEPCVYCDQGVPLLEAESFNHLANSIGVFDQVTFWQFIGQDKSYYDVGHWVSGRTRHHYLFRVLTSSIFSDWGFDLAARLRNSLRTHSIMPQWIRKIVIPDEPEAILLAESLLRVLGLENDCIIAVPRRFFSSVTPQDVGQDVIDFIGSKYGDRSLDGTCVLIVDQAAHHFKTVSALHRICRAFNASVLAFVVFIDRTQPGFSIDEFLPDSKYVALYSWHSPPKRGFDCLCTGQIH